MEGGAVIDLSRCPPPLAAQFEAQAVRTREAEGHKVEMYVVSGSDVLEGPYEWAGSMLPQVPVIGSEIPLEHGCYRYGVIRMARDPQQLYNYTQTAIAEYIGQAPKSPYLATADMIGAYKDQWETANVTNRSFLLYKPDKNAPTSKPERVPPPEMPTALIQQAQAAAEDMKRTTGIYDASLGAKSNENSGVAIARRQLEGDTANYHYADNFQRSLEYAGRVIVDLIPQIYDNERTLRILGEDDAEEFVEINKTLYEVGDQRIMINDLSVANFDVRVSIGPSQMTKRIEQAEFMTEFINLLDPAQRVAVMDILAKSQDWEGSEEVAKRLRNIIQQQMPAVLADPDDPNATPPPDPTDDPAFQLEAASQEAETQKKLADARKSNAQAEGQELENALVVGQAAAGNHPTQQDPMREKFFDAEQGERDAERSDRHRYEDRQWSVEDQHREAQRPGPRQQ
jgi:hypothetical protein